MQTADITEETTNKKNFTDPSNKVKIKRVPKQIKDLNGKIIILLELHRNISIEGEKKSGLWSQTKPTFLLHPNEGLP